MPEEETQGPIETTAPNAEALLEHHLIKSHEDARATHTLLEHHLVKGAEHDAKTEQQSDMHLDLESRILNAIELRPAVQEVRLVGPQITAVKGEKGDKGDKGDTGEKGEKGDQGQASTVPGPKGEKGDKGDRGEQGIPGKDGRDGIDGKDGKDGQDGRDGLDGKDGKDGSPDDGEAIISKIAGKLSYRDLKDAPEFPKMGGTGYMREITDVNTTGLQHGQVLKWNANTNKWEPGSSAGGAVPIPYDLSPYLNGSTKSFTIPANTAILAIMSSSAPNIFRPTVDYTGSGTTTLSFTAGVDAASMLAGGQTVIVIYY